MNRLIFEPNGWQNTLANGEERYSYQDNIRIDDGDQKVSFNSVTKVYNTSSLDMGYLSHKNLLRQDDKEHFFVVTKTTKMTEISRQYSGS